MPWNVDDVVHTISRKSACIPRYFDIRHWQTELTFSLTRYSRNNTVRVNRMVRFLDAIALKYIPTVKSMVTQNRQQVMTMMMIMIMTMATVMMMMITKTTITTSTMIKIMKLIMRTFFLLNELNVVSFRKTTTAVTCDNTVIQTRLATKHFHMYRKQFRVFKMLKTKQTLKMGSNKWSSFL